MRLTYCVRGIKAHACSCARCTLCVLGEFPLGVSDLLEDGLRATMDRKRPHRHRPNRQPQHCRSFRRRGKGVPSLGQRTVHARQRPGNIQSVARRTSLRLNANGPHPGRQTGQFIGDHYQFVVQLLVIHALQYLVVPVQSPMEAVVGAAPQALAELHIVLPPLPDGPKETHPQAQRYWPGPWSGSSGRPCAAPGAVARCGCPFSPMTIPGAITVPGGSCRSCICAAA